MKSFRSVSTYPGGSVDTLSRICRRLFWEEGPVSTCSDKLLPAIFFDWEVLLVLKNLPRLRRTVWTSRKTGFGWEFCTFLAWSRRRFLFQASETGVSVLEEDIVRSDSEREE
ncbi:hypothetical protein Taro_003900 [Colocasia esculenta]|uniref:Uncharacterized protein n=1 Tax=Colocasia esculenta TaxID=4460 RepID=A0A843TIJ1_COLES|nr:hypothetical protein [Colocasia esculenta]